MFKQKEEEQNLHNQYKMLEDDEIQSNADLERMKKDINVNEKLRKRYEAQYEKYSDHQAVFEDATLNFDYTLQEIMINPKGVKITASTDIEGQEQSSGTFLISKEEKEKWQVLDFQNKKQNTWVMFEFENPLLIRGYGVMTSMCEEEEEQSDDESERRDPMSYQLDAVNYLDSPPSADQKDSWTKLHKVENGKWFGRYELQKFDFKQKLVSKVRFKVKDNFGSDVMQIAKIKLYC